MRFGTKANISMTPDDEIGHQIPGSGVFHGFFSGLLLISLCLLSFSCQTAPRTSGTFDDSILVSGPEVLGLVAVVIERVPDIYNKTFLYQRLAKQYYQAGRVDLGSEIMNRALAKVRESGAREKYGMYLSMGVNLIQLGYRTRGKDLVKEAYDLIIQIPGERARGMALEELVQSCFRYPEVLGDILKDSVDYVYVLEDDNQRAQILTDLVFNYQASQNKGRVETVIQHIILAATSMDNVWTRLEVFTRICKAWKAEGDQEESDRWLQKSLQVLAGMVKAPENHEEIQKYVESLVRLTEFGRYREVGVEVARLPDPDAKISIQIALISAYLNQGAAGAFQARLAVQRLLNQAAQDEKSAVPGSESRNAGVLERLAEVYTNARMHAEAIQYADSAVQYLETHQVPDRDELRSGLGVVYARNGEGSRAMFQMNLISDNYLAAKTGIRLLDSLAENAGSAQSGTGQASRAALLGQTLQRARESKYMRDTVVAGVINSSWKLGLIDSTMDVIQEIKDPFVLAGTLMDVWKASESGSAERFGQLVKQFLRDWKLKPPA